MIEKILIRPIVTEKMTALMEERHYAFQVHKDANKVQIRRAVEAHYPGVKVKEVRTMIVRGKRRRQFTRRGPVEGRKASYKKAIVTLTADSDPIDFYEQV
ncbi:50S ribosomal protein L23 [Rhodocaloribacter litoris]|uniref:50S ribosomal protein L23 n=1 Tax=Rhodocaloribacter litoris TaxID=2558931 RepID=UPI00141E5BA5|nr:50S ribosomal protein L23 [Rhodocaloribacter litoris]QXD16729.1 50S ribosomal protein L23 [Rhodocaloribacter litoris]GIV59271.1 MAG: 50S ribosomal protein L23 [Rhodothermaceae bacterium]